MTLGYLILGVLLVLIVIGAATLIRGLRAVRDESQATRGKVSPLPNNLVTWIRGISRPDDQ